MDNVHEVEFSSKRHREIHSDRIHTRLNVSEGKISLHEIEEASDELEFRETELLRKRRELREAQAKLTVSEGKLSLQLTYAFLSTIIFMHNIYIYTNHP